jgi:hypothetical protein
MEKGVTTFRDPIGSRSLVTRLLITGFRLPAALGVYS